MRDFQASIADSVHKLLSDQITALGLENQYRVFNNSIIGVNGTEFIFKGLKINASQIKSTEGVDICWVEEAHSVSDESWELLIPTIRKPGSEIWISFNPMNEEDPTYRRFVKNPPPGAIVKKVGWRDNPWFPSVLKKEMEHMKEVDYEQYLHVWEGECKKIGDAIIFKGKFQIEEFETPAGVRYYHGIDWGLRMTPQRLCAVLLKIVLCILIWKPMGLVSNLMRHRPFLILYRRPANGP